MSERIVGMSRIGKHAVASGILIGGLAGAGAGYLALDPARAYSSPPGAIGPSSEGAVREALERRLPNTPIASVDCGAIAGVCEVTAGPNLFYVDAGGRYLMIGRVYDMETRQDMTAARLLELAPEALVAASARADGAPRGGGAPAPSVPSRLPLAELPPAGAIRWGPKSGPKLVVFSDFRCSYCRQLEAELRSLGARVEERPISVLGSRSLSEAVYCSDDPALALRRAYSGEEPAAGVRACDTSGLDANELFARRHGLNGTPVIVRSDGAVLEGYRPAAVIAAWLEGGRS